MASPPSLFVEETFRWNPLLNPSEQIANEQAEDEIEGAHARRQEQRADHQFRARDMLPGELTDIAFQSEPRLFRHWLALVFVDGIVGFGVHRH